MARDWVDRGFSGDKKFAAAMSDDGIVTEMAAPARGGGAPRWT